MAGGRKTAKREAALAALLSQPTLEQAAEKAGVSTRTLKGWLTDPDFQRAYRQERRRLVEGAVTRVQQACLKAVAALYRNLECGKPAAEIVAAKAILSLAIRAVEVQDLAQEVEGCVSRFRR